MSAAPYLSSENLAKGRAAWFAVHVDAAETEDIVTRRLRAAIVAAVGEQLVGQVENRSIALAELHAVADGIEAAHPFGVDVTLGHLKRARELLAEPMKGSAP